MYDVQPAQRVSLLRGKVKKLCEGVVHGAYGLVVGDSTKVTWLLEGIAYTFPHDYNICLYFPDD